MTEAQARTAPEPLTVGNIALPPWDRDLAASRTDLMARIGQQVALTRGNAAAMLGTKPKGIHRFVAQGIVRDAWIVSRPFLEGRVTHACVTASCWTRLHLEYGETLLGLAFGTPEGWLVDLGERDCDGRTCIRIRPLRDGLADELAVETDRRTYRVRLVHNRRKVTLACSWTYTDPVTTDASGRALGEPGETVRRRPSRGHGRLTRFILFELGADIETLVLRWAEETPLAKGWQLALYRKLYKAANIRPDRGHSRRVLEAVVNRLMEIGCFTESEVRQYLVLPLDAQPTVDMLIEMAFGRRRNRVPLARGVSPSMADLLAPFPFLAGLPETAYADPDLHQSPPERARRFVWTMRGVADHAALFCAVAPRYLRGAQIISTTLQRLASSEAMLAKAGMTLELGDPRSVSAAIVHLMSSPECDHLSDVVRHEIARSVLLVVRTLRRYIRVHDPEDVRSLHRLRPADPGRLAETLSRLGELRKTIGARMRAGRKGRVLPYAGRLAELQFAADLNLEQVVLTNRALRAAEQDLGETDWIEVPVDLTIVDPRGRLRPGKQKCIWRIWNGGAYAKRLLRSSQDKKERVRLQKLIDAAAAGATAPPVHEYRRTVGVLGSKPIEPYFVRCWRMGLMARPAPLPRRLRHKRHMVLRELKLPGFGLAPGGLLAGDAAQMELWRCSVRQSRTIVLLDPFEHALRFAHHGLSSVLENLSRTTAWIQQTQDQSGWEVRRLNKQPVAGFLAHDKMSAHSELPDEMSWFPVGPKHLAEGGELVAMTCRRCGYEHGLLPEIAHLLMLRDKRPELQAWTFSYSGSVLGVAFLQRALRFLLPGFGRLTYHDFRHLVANAAFDAGMPGWMVRLCLNHGCSDLWLYYAQLNAKQAARLEDASLRAVVVRSADARASRRAA